MTFGENLAIIRKSRGYTQRKLAKELGISQAAVGMWESGDREPNFETVEMLADFFNLPLSSLLPSDDSATDDLVARVADSLHKNPKLRLLFDRTRLMQDSDLDAVLSIVNAITKERDPE